MDLTAPKLTFRPSPNGYRTILSMAARYGPLCPRCYRQAEIVPLATGTNQVVIVTLCTTCNLAVRSKDTMPMIELLDYLSMKQLFR